MLKCYGGNCPLKEDCYRYTQPYTKRNAFAKSPYNPEKENCEYFSSNIPKNEQVREAAYYIWLHQEEPENRADENWSEAYQRLCLSTGRSNSA